MAKLGKYDFYRFLIQRGQEWDNAQQSTNNGKTTTGNIKLHYPQHATRKMTTFVHKKLRGETIQISLQTIQEEG